MLWFLAWEHRDSGSHALFWSLEASGDDPQSVEHETVLRPSPCGSVLEPSILGYSMQFA